MSGGVAYVLDEEGDFEARCNLELVELEQVGMDKDIDELRTLIREHRDATGSEVAQRILEDWTATVGKFVKVMPIDYKRVLEARAEKELVATHG
jgi:glutamate synthase domain-containing protein 3